LIVRHNSDSIELCLTNEQQGEMMKSDITNLKIDCENDSITVENDGYLSPNFSEALERELTRSKIIAMMLALKSRNVFKMSRNQLFLEYMKNHPLYDRR
jgi:hypothetical protein